MIQAGLNMRVRTGKGTSKPCSVREREPGCAYTCDRLLRVCVIHANKRPMGLRARGNHSDRQEETKGRAGPPRTEQQRTIDLYRQHDRASGRHETDTPPSTLSIAPGAQKPSTPATARVNGSSTQVPMGHSQSNDQLKGGGQATPRSTATSKQC